MVGTGNSVVGRSWTLDFRFKPSYIYCMNRRSFIQSLTAALSLPANPLLSLRPAAVAMPAAVEVPVRVKSWAVYMSNLHGECTPLTLQRLLHIPEADAKTFVSRLIADGVLRPNPVMQEAARKLLKPREDHLLDEVESCPEPTTEAEPSEVAMSESTDTGDVPDAEVKLQEAGAEASQAISDHTGQDVMADSGQSLQR